MRTKRSTSSEIGHRAELIAQLFLQDLKPSYLVEPTEDFGYDLLMGVPNAHGGINNFAVQIKATEEPVPPRFPIQTKLYVHSAYSNVPVLLLVVDVKQNRLYYAWLTPGLEKTGDSRKVAVPVTEINDEVKEELRLKVRSPITNCDIRSSFQGPALGDMLDTPQPAT
jgi:hypothetical protein